ncbi:MAG: YjbQ family protein [Thaumarchaeota archaeon]|jgi:secondary thiamine-phosphate synthase enzyme|nr:YjbQ family protein [Nitrososphaerota archaeon]
MAVVTKEIRVQTRGECDIVNLTDRVQEAVGSSGLKDGVVAVFVGGSTAAITTIEYEPGLLQDLPAALERVAPKNVEYKHEEMWHDGNGHSHVRASILGPSLVVPFKERRLCLGTWQQIVLVELDIRARSRNIILQILGE